MADAPIRHPMLQRLYAAWCGLGAAGALPSFRRFDPVEVPGALGQILVVAVERAPLRFRYRVFPTRLTALMHRELTGHYVDEIDDLPERDLVLERMARGATDARPTVMIRTGRTPDYLITFESLMLPFADDGAAVDTLAFGMEPIERRELSGLADPTPRLISEIALDRPPHAGAPPP